MIYICVCKYCNHTWETHFWGATEFLKVQCEKCHDKEVTVKKKETYDFYYEKPKKTS